VKATSPDSTTIKVTWERPAKMYDNGVLEGYIVRYKRVNEPDYMAFTIEDPNTTVRENFLNLLFVQTF